MVPLIFQNNPSGGGGGSPITIYPAGIDSHSKVMLPRVSGGVYTGVTYRGPRAITQPIVPGGMRELIGLRSEHRSVFWMNDGRTYQVFKPDINYLDSTNRFQETDLRFIHHDDKWIIDKANYNLHVGGPAATDANTFKIIKGAYSLTMIPTRLEWQNSVGLTETYDTELQYVGPDVVLIDNDSLIPKDKIQFSQIFGPTTLLELLPQPDKILKLLTIALFKAPVTQIRFDTPDLLLTFEIATSYTLLANGLSITSLSANFLYKDLDTIELTENGVDVIGRLMRPEVIDAAGNRAFAKLHLQRINGHTYVSIAVPYSFMYKATYPVYIDPDVRFNFYSNWGYIQSDARLWEDARNGYHLGDPIQNSTVGIANNASQRMYFIARSFLVFDTTALTQDQKDNILALSLSFKPNTVDSDNVLTRRIDLIYADFDPDWTSQDLDDIWDSWSTGTYCGNVVVDTLSRKQIDFTTFTVMQVGDYTTFTVLHDNDYTDVVPGDDRTSIVYWRFDNVGDDNDTFLSALVDEFVNIYPDPIESTIQIGVPTINCIKPTGIDATIQIGQPVIATIKVSPIFSPLATKIGTIKVNQQIIYPTGIDATIVIGSPSAYQNYMVLSHSLELADFCGYQYNVTITDIIELGDSAGSLFLSGNITDALTLGDTAYAVQLVIDPFTLGDTVSAFENPGTQHAIALGDSVSVTIIKTETITQAITLTSDVVVY